ncbi:MAG: preprotein translocase subunit SecG [Polyangiaceae bacterium]|nr:preprotein translocase subunit SecG [Polyangiaceae bacterium]
MLNILLTILHIVACLFLILVVLLQQGRGGGLGSAFGGATTQQVFGGRGAGNLLTRLTSLFAAVFMCTSIGLAYLASAGDIKLRAIPTRSSVNTTQTTNLPLPSAPPAAPPAPSAPSDGAPAAPEGSGAPVAPKP